MGTIFHSRECMCLNIVYHPLSYLNNSFNTLLLYIEVDGANPGRKFDPSVSHIAFGADCFCLKSVFHWILRLRWVPNATKNETNNMKSTCPMQTQLWCTQRHLYSTCLHWGLVLAFALGVTQILACPTCWYRQREIVAFGV